MRIAIMSRKRSLYSTKRLVEETGNLSHEPMVLNPLKCDLLTGGEKPVIYFGRKKITGIDVVIPRIGSAVTRYGLNVIRQFLEAGVPSIGDPERIAIARDKYHCVQTLDRAGVPVPRTVMIRNPSNIEQAIDRVGGVPAVIKLIRGTQGKGVILVESKKNATSVIDALQSLGQQMIIQQYIIESNGTDIRCLVVGGRIVACCRRTARIGEFRSNFHKGSLLEPVDVSDELERIALDAAAAIGVNVAGVDLLEAVDGYKVLEVNASPGFEGVESCTSVNVAREIIRFAVQTAESHKRKGNG